MNVIYRYVVMFVCVICLATSVGAMGAGDSSPKIPVIFDTDIGDDIDDTWALCMLLKSPELDVKLIVGDMGDAKTRAKLIAKFLERAERTDIPVGIGLRIKSPSGNTGRQNEWIKDYDLKKYPGKVYEDGVQAIIDTIMNSPEKVTLLCVGPVPNIAEALKREPRIAEKARFVGMHGSVRMGYGGSKTPAAEWNVRADAAACMKTLHAPWEVTITPIDTCGLIQLKGERYAKVRDCKDPLTRTLVENYRIWLKARKANPAAADSHSSTLYDTVAVYLAFAEDLVEIETLEIKVTEKGMTVLAPGGKKMRVASRWKNMEAYNDLLVERVTGKTVPAGKGK